MLKQFLGLMLGLFTLGQLEAQGKKPASFPPPPANQHLRVFEQAAQSGDAATAITALHYYLLEKGSNRVYADTLAMLYMQQGSYRQCLYWAEKALLVNPEDHNLLELKGISLDKLQQPREAIAIFENLLEKTKSPYHGYKLMELQYGMKRLQECLATGIATEKLEFKPAFTMTYTSGNQLGRTYLEAGVYNIMGLAYYDLGQKAAARSYFQKALALDTSFLLAKQNLEATLGPEKGKQPGSANTPGRQPPASPAGKQN